MKVSNNDTVTALVYMANNRVIASRSRPGELQPLSTLLLPFFLKFPPRSNMVHISATFFSPGPAGTRLVDMWRVTLMVAECCFSYLQWLF